ncbi:MAG: VOC family protein [Nitrososphaeraceae archaeon]
MTTKLFANLPVKDLDKTIKFFTHLDFTFNPQFTDENATCMIIGKDSFVMLLVEKFFKTFTNKEICDATTDTEVILALSAESREQVDNMITKVNEAGGREYMKSQDYGWMYHRGFEDINGHIWEIVYMDESSIPK